MPSLKQKRGTYRNVGANPIGAFINKDKVEGGRLSDRGRLLEGERQNESLRYLSIAASKLLRSNQPDYVFQSNSRRRVCLGQKSLGPGTVTTEHFPNDHSQNIN